VLQVLTTARTAHDHQLTRAERPLNDLLVSLRLPYGAQKKVCRVSPPRMQMYWCVKRRRTIFFLLPVAFMERFAFAGMKPVDFLVLVFRGRTVFFF
jgi:hypothetical protein